MCGKNMKDFQMLNNIIIKNKLNLKKSIKKDNNNNYFDR